MLSAFPGYPEDEFDRVLKKIERATAQHVILSVIYFRARQQFPGFRTDTGKISLIDFMGLSEALDMLPDDMRQPLSDVPLGGEC